MFKRSFDTIIADTVWYPAAEFWEKMGFVYGEDGHYVYRNRRLGTK